MSYTLPSVWTFLGIFVVALIIWHVLLIRWRPLSAMRWRYVDYIWLGVSVLAIVGAVDKFRSASASDILKQSAAQWEFVTTAQPTNSEGMQDVVCKTGNAKDDASCADWYGKAIEMMRTAKESPEAWSQLALPPTSALGVAAKQEADIKNEIVASIRKQAAERLELIRIADGRGPLSAILLFCALVLFPVALALRITKVTGEIRIAKAAGS